MDPIGTADPADGLASRYAFSLPPELVAQKPAERRDAARLMHLLPDGTAEDRIFSELPELLAPGDILVRNDVRVFPARLRGRRRGGGTAEVLLVRREDLAEREIWLCLARPANRFKPGREFAFGDGELIGRALGLDDRGMARLEFPLVGPAFMEILERLGQVPLPPYIARPGGVPTPEDTVRYQTVYAARPGAVAAPTAGLHFTPEVDGRLRERGVQIAGLTLHVGPGTFRPIKAVKLDSHRMDPEWFEISPASWREVLQTRKRGGRVVAVGTTTVRALETAAAGGELSGWTDIFIRPGHRFALVDGLVTNFHLP
ncbi:MAG: tRNA preQ1(34) S-adenosylmethionine ribosyltransferase-isomerase QueA, partial [Planctomycetota bacterium]|nr:tRNA preQ1(34) S-adenosylmethionine ribosyltransferase-isomerase QueA [Planctomycetota bacterium]